MPVTVAKIDRQIMSAIRKLCRDIVDDLSIQCIERAYAAEMKVVLPYYFEALTGNATASGYILQKWNNLLVSFRATERKNEEGVK